MKIIGGSYGVSGSAWISTENNLVIESARKTRFTHDDIQTMSSSTTRERKFSLLSLIVGVVILGGLLSLLFGIIGLIVGVILTIAGSMYSVPKHQVEITFSDHSTLVLACTKSGANMLFRFWHGEPIAEDARAQKKTEWLLGAAIVILIIFVTLAVERG